MSPPWELLPHDPVGFFGLAEGFDRKDLKRSYNALLREFKPEKHPAEFQRIRAAYESIEQQLRYGRELIRRPRTSRYNWPSEAQSRPESTPPEAKPPSPVSADPSRPPPESTRPKGADAAASHRRSGEDNRRTATPAAPPQATERPLIERVLDESPQSLYAELRNKAAKSPYDFYALALLADVVQRDDPLLFLKWLLTGLKAHPHEPALINLLQAYLQHEIADQDCRRVLLAVAKAVPDESFFYLTERLWDQALRCLSFEDFDAVLRQCEVGLSDHRVQGRVVFYTHILRAAMWKAPREWVERTLTFLNQHGEWITHHLEYDLELTTRLWEYHQARASFLNGRAARQRIDQAIESFCTLESRAGERTLVECQAYLAGNPSEVLSAFSLHQPFPREALRAWSWVSEEVLGRLGLDDEPEDLQAAGKRLLQMLVEIDQDEPVSRWQTFVALKNLSYIVGSFLMVFWCPLLLGWLLGGSAPAVVLYAIIGLGSLIAFWLWWRKRTVVPLFDRIQERMVRKRYLSQWRDAIVLYFAATHLTFHQFLETSQAIIKHYSKQLNVSTWVPIMVSRDGALLVIALAQRFLQ